MEQNPKLAKLLVKRLMKKHGVDAGVQLSEEEKQELQEVIESMKVQVEDFLNKVQESQTKSDTE